MDRSASHGRGDCRRVLSRMSMSLAARTGRPTQPRRLCPSRRRRLASSVTSSPRRARGENVRVVCGGAFYLSDSGNLIATLTATDGLSHPRSIMISSAMADAGGPGRVCLLYSPTLAVHHSAAAIIFLHEERATASLHLGSAYAPGFFFCGLTAFRSMPFARSSAIVCETFIRLSKPFCCS